VLNVKAIIVSKMTSRSKGTVQMGEESESGIRKWEEMWFKTRAEDGERGGAAVTCGGSLFHRRAVITGERFCCSIEAALSVFSQMRPPGIYKQDYLDELFTRYGEHDDTPSAPSLPDWCLG